MYLFTPFLFLCGFLPFIFLLSHSCRFLLVVMLDAWYIYIWSWWIRANNTKNVLLIDFIDLTSKACTNKGTHRGTRDFFFLVSFQTCLTLMLWKCRSGRLPSQSISIWLVANETQKSTFLQNGPFLKWFAICQKTQRGFAIHVPLGFREEEKSLPVLTLQI